MSSDHREGIALVTTLLVLVAVGSIAAAATLLTQNSRLIASANDRFDLMEAAADAGLELGRATVNGTDLIPGSGYVVLEDGVAPVDALGDPIPGLRRWTYAGPRGITTGQYGVFASVVSVVEMASRDRVVRRADLLQHSFARYAYFTDIEPSDIRFGAGDQLFGPVHSNAPIRIWTSTPGPTFHGVVTTAEDVQGEDYATFREGYQEEVPVIPMPTTADLAELRALADQADMDFAPSSGDRLRLEFLALDVNGDGDTTDPHEGFLVAYESSDENWVDANAPSDMRWSRNCGQYRPSNNRFDPVRGESWSSRDEFLADPLRRCFLGGDPRLDDQEWGDKHLDFGWDSRGEWERYPGSVHGDLTTAFGATAQYLYPLSRTFNPEFNGVIHVQGDVAVSGRLRSRVTLAATGDITIVDDIVYATDPAEAARQVACQDILGLFAGGNIEVGRNTLNEPQHPSTASNARAYTFDDTSDEFVHGTMLALSEFRAERWNRPQLDTWADYFARTEEACEGQPFGRGCLYLTGGVIQRTRGAVATTINGVAGGTGYVKRYAYDRCAAKMPPPYFPTTGHYTRDRYFSVDPAGFDVDAYFDALAAGS